MLCVAFWLPQVVKSFSSLSNSAVATVSALPFVTASILMVITANHSDRTCERRRHVAIPALAGSLGFAFPVYFSSVWSMPTAFLSGTAAAGGVALINSVGNIGGFLGPYVIGYVRATTGSYLIGMLVLSATLLIAAVLALRVKA